MNHELKVRLESFRDDYAQKFGAPFQHFYCPVLAVDEDVELQKGHIVNQAFVGAPRDWVPQRSDVDRFFGSNFEADFEFLQYGRRMSLADAIADRKWCQGIRPRILRDGKPIQFTGRPGPLPSVFTPASIEDEGKHVTLGMKMSLEELLASAGSKWEFEFEKDMRVGALVSLIKAAHLTMFHLLRYRYAGSAAGLFVGRDLLGRFYLENRDKGRKQVRDNALSYFREFQHMVRPIVSRGVCFQGTITDKRLFVCVGSSGRIWGLIVFINIGDSLHAVLLPVFDEVESIVTFMDFLRNDNESIQVTVAEYDREAGCWREEWKARSMTWPKTGVLYPRSGK